MYEALNDGKKSEEIIPKISPEKKNVLTFEYSHFF